MSRRVLLFIHGVRHEDHEQTWLESLERTLRRRGTDGMEARGYEVVTPRYLELLDAVTVPNYTEVPMTYRKGSDAEHAAAAGRYWSSLTRLERSGIREHEVTPDLRSQIPPDGPHANFVMGKLFPQAERYRKDRERRRAIQSRVVEAIPADCELVVIAHSLGSVVAADLLYHLPPRVRLRLLMTIGSPLSLQPLRDHLERRRNQFPFEVAGPWLNLIGSEDFVTGHRGLSRIFPEPLDLCVDTGGVSGAHAATRYLDHEVVGMTLDWLDDEGVDAARRIPTRNLPEARLSSQEISLLVGAQYALRLEQAQEAGAQRDRYAQARALVLDDLARGLRENSLGAGAADRLTFDNSRILRDRFSAAGAHLDAVPLLLSAHLLNPIDPFEIRPRDEVLKKALCDLADDLDLPSIWSARVIEAAAKARAAQRAGIGLKQVALAAAGVAVVAAMPMLVLAAAPAGLAGGAAIVGGLAALGPGGMLGGIGIVSLLGGAGGAVTARALTAGSVAQVEQTVVYLHAQALARQALDISEPGRPEWHALAQMEDAAAEDYALKRTFSDSGSQSVKDAERKLRSVERALEAMMEQGLAPAQDLLQLTA